MICEDVNICDDQACEAIELDPAMFLQDGFEQGDVRLECLAGELKSASRSLFCVPASNLFASVGKGVWPRSTVNQCENGINRNPPGRPRPVCFPHFYFTCNESRPKFQWLVRSVVTTPRAVKLRFTASGKKPKCIFKRRLSKPTTTTTSRSGLMCCLMPVSVSF